MMASLDLLTKISQRSELEHSVHLLARKPGYVETQRNKEKENF